MFSYLRLFSILSVIVVLAFATAAGMAFRNMEIEGLAQINARNSIALSQGYIDNIWKKYRDILVPVTIESASQLKDNPQVTQFAQDTVQYFRRMSPLRLNIYNANGVLLMSVNAVDGDILKFPGNASSPNPQFVSSRLRDPQIATAPLHHVSSRGIKSIALLQTLVPIRDIAESNNDGMLEMLYDMSDPWQRIETFQTYGMVGLGGLFVMFLSILFITFRRAETIIARQHEGNLELAAAAAAAEAENREKSQFLANISHELRTPLNAIIGFSDIIKTEAMPKIQEKKYHDYINDIHGSGVHLLSLINDILDYSKAEAGKLELEVTEVNVTKLVQNSMRLVLPRAEASQISLVEAMPKEQIVMHTDSKKFRQILLNLLSNAVKFTPAGGQVRIAAWRNVTDDTYSFEVKDNGIGIAPKDISRAMTPFGQVDSALSRKYEGTGLGLPLTKKFVELMGGKFAIESKLNAGTSVVFTLPKNIPERDGVIVKRQEE